MPTAADSNAGRPRLWRRWARRLGAGIVGLYVVGCSGLYALQDKMLFPGHSTQGTKDAAATFTPGVERVTLATADGTPIVARFSPADSTNAAPTVLFCYGNAMCAAWCDGIVAILHDLGCNVLVADYAGYGESGGKPSEAGCYATADAAWAYLQSRTDVDRRQIVVMGWSLGAAVATDLASRRPAAGLITLSAFTSVPDVARQTYPLLPTDWLVRSKFNNLAKVPSVKCPALLFHGRQDTLITPSNADKLAAAYGPRAELVWLQSADHNTMFEAEPELLRETLQRFLNRLTPPVAPTTQALRG